MNSIDVSELQKRLANCEAELCDYRIYVAALSASYRLEVLKDASLVFKEFCRDRAREGDSRLFLLVLSMPPTESLSVMNEDIDLRYEKVDSVIFYALRSFNYLPEAHEEYRKQVYEDTLGIRGMFRSWRSPEHARNRWEFSNDIYVRVDD